MFEEREVLQQVVGVTQVRLSTWVSRGWVCPVHSETGRRFTETDVARCALIREFEDDLGIDADTLPVVLSLLDQIHGLRHQLKVVTRAIDAQPDDVRANIRRAMDDTRD
jgi:chaperone modulatory protein CbpM